MPLEDALPYEEETLEVVRTAARIAFGEGVIDDQCIQLHDLIMHGLSLRGFEVLAHEETGD